MPITLRVFLGAVALFVLGLAGLHALAGPARHAVVIGFQTEVDPGKLAQVGGAYDRALGRPLQWRKFDSGTDVITALAAGDIDFGYLGSSPLAIAATRQLPITTVVLASRLGSSETLMVRDSAHIARGADLAGKRVAVPFVSTSHYSLLAALAHWHVAPDSVQIINLAPPQIAAAWARGDIDAAYVWEPALSALRQGGHALVGSDTVADWGAPTYDAWVVRREFARTNPSVVAAFVRVTLDAMRTWQQSGSKSPPDPAQIGAVAALTGVAADAVPAMLSRNTYPDAAAQAGPRLLGGGLADDLAATAGFLKSQGKVDRVLPDYRPFIDARWARAAAQDTPSQ